jgi:hypothetical protein
MSRLLNSFQDLFLYSPDQEILTIPLYCPVDGHLVITLKSYLGEL